MKNAGAPREQQMSRGEMIFSQKRHKYWLLSCSLGEVAALQGARSSLQSLRLPPQ